MGQRGSHCPWAGLRETTDSGTGECASAGQEDPVELDSSPARGAVAARERTGERGGPETPRRRAPPRSPAGTAPGGEFGWGGAPATAQRRRPKAGSAGTETPRGA